MTPDNKVLQRCSKARTPKNVYKQRGQATGQTVSTEQKKVSPTLKNWIDTEWRPSIKQHCSMKFGGSGVTVWGAMLYRGTGFLIPLKGNLDKNGYLDILRNSGIPSAHLLGYGDNFIFQDYSAPCHRANVVQQWKSDQNIRCLEQPPQSPDLNPIENLWRHLGEAVRRARCHYLNELQQALVYGWSQIPVRRFQRLIRSMPN